jgi:hypothetical protein
VKVSNPAGENWLSSTANSFASYSGNGLVMINVNTTGLVSGTTHTGTVIVTSQPDGVVQTVSVVLKVP